MSDTKLSLTPELREHYILAINKIWPDFQGRFNSNHVTDEVADMMDTVLNSISQCSDAMALIHELYEDFYMPFSLNKWRKIIKEAIDVYQDWLEALDEDRTYRVCVLNAARTWKSSIFMALSGF